MTGLKLRTEATFSPLQLSRECVPSCIAPSFHAPGASCYRFSVAISQTHIWRRWTEELISSRLWTLSTVGPPHALARHNAAGECQTSDLLGLEKSCRGRGNKQNSSIVHLERGVCIAGRACVVHKVNLYGVSLGLRV